MRNLSHTLIAVVRTHVQAWRKREGWSRETVVQMIVEAHEAAGAAITTGIRFEPGTTDAFGRAKVNADRVFRWLDDETKDNNLLPANFLPSVLQAMPLDVRTQCLDDVLLPLGLACRVLHADDDPAVVDAISHLRAMTTSDAAADQAVINLLDGATDAELVAAQRALRQKMHDASESLADIEAAVKARGIATHG